MVSGWKRPLQLAAASLVAFGVLLCAAYWLPVARWADGWAVEGFLGLQRPSLDVWASRVAHLADPVPFAPATAALAAIAVARERHRHAAAVVFLLVGASVTSQV